MKLLPRDQWIFQIPNKDMILVSAHEHPPGARYWTKILFADLPTDLVTFADLRRLRPAE